MNATSSGNLNTMALLSRWLKSAITVAILLVLIAFPRTAISQLESSQQVISSTDKQNASPTYAPSVETQPSSALSRTQSVFTSSVPESKPIPGVLQLTFKDAIDRALRNNLGFLLASDNSLAARGKKWEELSHLLPNVSAQATQSAAQIDLAALGFVLPFPACLRLLARLVCLTRAHM